jgi:hypothetical protein
VEVRADAQLVETHENAVSTLIDNKQITELPLNGRNAPALILLSGGAANVTLSGNDLNSSKNYGNGDNSSSSTSQTISVGGGQENSNNYLLDGGDNNDAFSNINAPFPFPDAIQEFKVQSNGGSARYGVHAGATVNVVTKSGTNKFHGSVFEFLRNPELNAHHILFSTPVAGSRDDTIKRNQFGGTFGGPIFKDKLLFFVGYQGTRQSSSSLSQTLVPTAAVLAGDWTAFTGKQLKAPYVGNKIDPSLYNQQALNLLQAIPVATSPDGKITFSSPGIVNEDQGIARLDLPMSSKSTLFTRYFATDYRAPIPFDPTNILPQGKTASQFSRYQSLAIGHTYTLTPNLVNSFRVTGTRLAINRGPANGMITPADIGVNVPSPIPSGLVLSISSYFTTGGGTQMPGHFINNLYQVADDVDYIHGKHEFSFGANFMKMQLNYLSTFQSNGQFTFNGSTTGDNLADFMLGLVTSYVQGNPEAENWRYTYIGLYAHDNIRLRHNLTLNAGIRWEPFFPSHDALDRGSHFDFGAFMAGTHSTVFPNAPAGLLYCGDKGIPCAFSNHKLAQFSPRAGLIWDPRGHGQETIRASYGLFYDSPEMYFFDRYADNSPYGSAVNIAKPVGGFTNPYQGQTVPQFPLPFPKAGDPNAFFPVNGIYINNPLNIKPMYVQSWNLSLEKQLGHDWLISASYLGSKTTHIWIAYEANPGLNQATVATPAASAGGSGCAAGAAAATGNVNCRRTLVELNPTQGQFISNLTSLWDGANSEYSGMLLSVRHRFSHNFTLLTNYTWSHCISDSDFSGELTNSRPTLFPSPINDPNFDALRNDRGNCGFDIRHIVNGSLVVNSPKFQQKLTNALLGGWVLAPLVTYRTGQYFTVLTGVDGTLTGATTSLKDRPNQTGDPLSGNCVFNLPGGVTQTFPVGSRNCWFNNTVFALPPAGGYGDVGRNSLTGPGAFTFDTAVSRKFLLGESRELQLRFEAFNVLNHPVLGNPVASRNSTATFGKIQSQVGDGRTIQGAVKFAF